METPTPIPPFWHIYRKLRFRALFSRAKAFEIKTIKQKSEVVTNFLGRFLIGFIVWNVCLIGKFLF